MMGRRIGVCLHLIFSRVRACMHVCMHVDDRLSSQSAWADIVLHCIMCDVCMYVCMYVTRLSM